MADVLILLKFTWSRTNNGVGFRLPKHSRRQTVWLSRLPIHPGGLQSKKPTLHPSGFGLDGPTPGVDNAHMAIGIDPRVDYVFKRVFGDENNALVLVDLLNAVLEFPPGKLVRGVTMLNPFVASDYVEGKVPI